jgi:hypothetical protein
LVQYEKIIDFEITLKGDKPIIIDWNQLLLQNVLNFLDQDCYFYPKNFPKKKKISLFVVDLMLKALIKFLFHS